MRKAKLMMIGCVALFAATMGQAQAGLITTMFASNNGQSGNMFDVQVFNNPLLVTSLDLNLDLGSNWNLELYTKTGSYVGYTTTPAAWTLVSAVSGIASNGTDASTPVDFADFLLPANLTSAIYVTVTNGSAIKYTNGTGVGNTVVSNTDLQIFEGAGKAYSFSTTFQPRIWNGSIHYEVQSTVVPEPTAIALMGLGLAGLGFTRRRKRS